MKNRSWHIEILFFFLFILLSIIATYPLIFRMSSYLYGSGGDVLGSFWTIWWRKYAHLNPLPSGICPFVASPFGISTGPVLNLFLLAYSTLILSLLYNEVFAYNFLVLISFPLAALTMYFLVYYFTRNKLASMVSGIIYAFCPYHLTHAAQHLGLVSIQWMPLYMLALFKLAEEKTYRNAFFWAVALFLTVLFENHYGYFMVIVTLAFIFWWGWQGLRNKRLKLVNKLTSKQVNKGTRFHSFKVVVVAIVVAVAIILPFTYSTFKTALFTPKTEEIMSRGYVRPFRDLASNSARPLGYLLPSQDNPFFSSFV